MDGVDYDGCMHRVYERARAFARRHRGSAVVEDVDLLVLRRR
jgi:hypothetical protein